jgi:hypothetical protein
MVRLLAMVLNLQLLVATTGKVVVYVDSRHGSDNHSGTSVDTPWRSLARLEAALGGSGFGGAAVVLGAGDEVRLARGGVWREGLSITGGGNASHGPLLLSSYGDTAAPKPLLLGSVAVGGAGNWSAVSGSPGQWRTFRQHLVPAPGAVQLINNADYASGGAFWALWNEHPEGSSHVSGGVVNSSAPAPCANRSFAISFRSMDAALTSYTQLYTTHMSVVSGRSYLLSFWARATASLNVTEIALFSMQPPFTPYAQAVGPVLLRSGGWRKYTVSFHATSSSSVRGARITWFFANAGSSLGKERGTGRLPNDAQVWLASSSLKHAVNDHPGRVDFSGCRDIGNLLLFRSALAGPGRAEPSATGWKRWSVTDVRDDGDFHFDGQHTKQLTVFCGKGPPQTCWPGGVEAAKDTNQVELVSRVIALN